jgi:hypothetical protein
VIAKITRRHALKAGASAGALAGLGDLSFLSQLNPVAAAEAKLEPSVVRLQPDIEPLVRFIEETPRDKLLEETAHRIKGGLSYRDLLAALLLAGVKNVEPRPSVGHKFHTVLVVNSAHLASMASPSEHRWLPIFWALDYYKSAATRDVEERGDWTMSAVDESAVPSARKCKAAFVKAMDHWEESAVDASVAGLARTAGANEIYELFFRYGMRDFRSIGHKAIYVANSFRTLNCIGWQHAEPVLRSLAYALLSHEGGDNPAKRDDPADRPFRRNQELAKKVSENWQGGKVDNGATREMLATLRTASNDGACDQVVELLNRGIAPQSVFDALHVFAGEMLMRQPGIVPLHAVTTTNALHYAYQASADDETRRLLLLQNAAFLPMFRESMSGRGQVKKLTIDVLDSAEKADAEATGSILDQLSDDPMAAAQKLLAMLRQAPPEAEAARNFMNDARVVVFFKGDDAHDYKFSSAVLEDYYHVSPEWRDIYLASNVFNLPGTGAPDNKLIERARAALSA